MTRRFHDVIDPAIAAPGQPVDLARPATPRQGVLLQAANRSRLADQMMSSASRNEETTTPHKV
jgi:hypothetical protein